MTSGNLTYVTLLIALWTQYLPIIDVITIIEDHKFMVGRRCTELVGVGRG